jgi:hypothetical protein
VNRLLRHRLLRAVLTLCLLGQLAASALAFAQPCAMPGEGEHSMATTAHHGALADSAVMDTAVMDTADCCGDAGPCLMAHCMAPVGACAALPVLVRLPVAAAAPAAPALIPRAVSQRHFRPPIAA